MIAAALVAGVFVLYVATYASIPAGDGYWVLNNIDRANFELLFNPPSLLTQLGFFGLRRLADALGLSIGTLAIIQTVNALAAGVGAALLYGIVRLLGGSRTLAALTAALLAVSFGYWQFANGELQLMSLVVLLLIFWLIVRARVHGAWTWPFVIGVGLLNALATLLRQENVLFGLSAVALLCIGRPWRAAARDALTYALAGSIGTWASVLVLAQWAPGVHTAADSVRWYSWILHEHIGQPQDFQSFEHATKFDVPRVVKGQLTALIVGTQVVVDALRDRALLARPKVLGLVALTSAAVVLLVVLAADLRRLRRVIEARLLAVAVACAVWVLSYKVIVHAWLWPTVTKYQVVTVPPLIILSVLGLIAAQKSGAHARSAWRIGLLAALVVIVFTVDFWGGILPWWRYGEMKAALDTRRAAEFRADDLFVSCESGIDPIFPRLYRGGDEEYHVSVKKEFVKHPTSEALATIRQRIERQLALKRRVFVYNFVPAPYSLIAINQSPVRGGTPLSARDFEAFLDELRKTYAIRPLFPYWEESKAPLYLFGERLEPFFEVSARS